MTTSPPTIGGDTDAIRRYAAEVRAHGEDIYLSVREHTRNVRNAFIEEASAHTRDGGVAPVYEELKTALFSVMDRLDDAAAVIRREQEDTAAALEDAARDFDQHDDDASDRLSRIAPVDLTSGPPPVENKPGTLYDGPPPVENKPGVYTGPVGGPPPVENKPAMDTDPDPDDVADTLGGAIGETDGGHSMSMAGLPGGVPLHARTDTTPLPDVASIVDDAIDHPQRSIHVTDLPGGVPGPRVRSSAAIPPDHRFDA